MVTPMEIYYWCLENWDVLVQAYLALVGFASIVVKLTPTLKDDAYLKSVIRFMGKYVALNRK